MGGGPKYLKKLQVILNNSTICHGGRQEDITKTLQEKCGWLDVKETVQFQMAVMMWHALRMKTPRQLAEKFTVNEDSTVSTAPARLMTVRTSFHWRGVTIWNNLSQEWRNNLSHPRFRKDLRKWLIAQRHGKQMETGHDASQGMDGNIKH